MSARIVRQPGNPGPINEGERRVLEHLARTLPDSFELHPNLQIAVGRGSLVETDIVVLGPDCIWIVEVKDLAGTVVVEEHEFVVNGEPRTHPVGSTRVKAQKIKSRLAMDPLLARVWLQPIVVLAREPRSLRLTPTMTPFVFSIDRAPTVIADPTLVGLQQGRLTEETRTRAASRLALDASTRPPRSRFGAYLADELLAEGGGVQWWRAHQQLFDNNVLLEVVPEDVETDPATRAVRREAALRAARVGQLLGPHPNLVAPETAFVADDGAVVIVHPLSALPTLETIDIDELSDDARRRALAGVARLIDHCHRKGVAHRTLGPRVIHVDPNGFARVTGFGHARMTSGGETTVTPSDWSVLGQDFWLAPEHAGHEVGPAADLFALGRLIEYLWRSGAPTDLHPLITSLTEPDPSRRSPTAGEVATIAQTSPPKQVRRTPGIGETLGGRFVLERKLGGGTQATVWAASDLVTNRPVALKLYRTGEASDQLQREYEALLDETHPGVVRVRDANKLDGLWGLVTELLDGPSLRAAMLERGQIPVAEAVPIALSVLDALRSVHPDVLEIARLTSISSPDDAELERLARLRTSGVIHRDVKPENIVLTMDRGPVLVDFGLATEAGRSAVGGTAAYRPPDVVADGSDPDVDLFAVGVILHELVTGFHPYDRRDPVAGELDVRERLDEELRAVLLRACSRSYEERFRSASEFIDALAAMGIEGREMSPPEPSVVDRLRAIEDAIAERRWNDAFDLCPADWAVVREKIEHRRALDEDAEANEPVLEMDGFSLTFVGVHRFETAADTGGTQVGPGSLRIYFVHGPSGEALEMLDHRADTGERWVQVGDVFQTPMPLKRLAQGLRLGSTRIDGHIYLELRQARLTGDNWSNLFRAAIDELDSGAGTDVSDVLRGLGALAIGSREEVLGDTGRRRNYLCVTCSADSEHVPAAVYFITRVLPLSRSVSA